MLLLVTGASGAGKSTVRRQIAEELAPDIEAVELVDVFAEPPTWTIEWRQRGAEAAVCRALLLQAERRHLLLSGDPVVAGEVLAAPSADRLDGIAVCLLDVAEAAQAARLSGRGDDPALLPHHQAFAAWMRTHAVDPTHMLDVLTAGGWESMRWERIETLAGEGGWGMEVVETSWLDPEAVATCVLDWCRRALSRDAPVMYVPNIS